MDHNELMDFLTEFIEELKDQMMDDFSVWGNTWKSRTREGQELRIEARYNDYFDQFKNAGTPIPWLKVIGNAYIAWARETHPEYLEN